MVQMQKKLKDQTSSFYQTIETISIIYSKINVPKELDYWVLNCDTCHIFVSGDKMTLDIVFQVILFLQVLFIATPELIHIVES